jgi:hypothetical protein
MDYAIVNQNKEVENVVVLEEGSNWTPPVGFLLVPLSGSAGIGWTWDGTKFIAPPKEEENS